jgi:hypothetical protein
MVELAVCSQYFETAAFIWALQMKKTQWQYLSVSLLSNTLFKISKGNKKYINLNVK